MKKFTLFVTLLCVCLGISAQSHIRVWQNGDDNRMKLVNVGEMAFKGSTISIKGEVYETSAIDSIIIVPEVTVQYNGTKATVNIPDAIAKDVTAEISGAHVTLTNSNVSNEIEVVLSGTSTNGSLTYNGQYKCTFFLNGLNLTSTVGCPLDIECGKRVGLVLNEGTTNSLTDAATGTQKACLYCKGHLEVEGAGTLTVTANAKHGIATKEYLQLKRSTGTINIAKAASDAIHVGQYFQMNGGTINVTETTAGDGIQSEYILLDGTTTPDPAEENNGQVIIKGGNINMTIASEDCKGIKADSLITISGGTIDIKAKGNGTRGIQTDCSMTISEVDNTTSITIAAAGGKCTVAEDAKDPHKCMGIKVGGDLNVSGGTTTVTATGNKAKGIKVGGTYTKTGGTVNAVVSY